MPIAHSSGPVPGAVPDEVLAEVMRSLDTDYAARIRHLGEELRGKTVADSAGGHSGYLLRFTDGSWVAVWLDPQSSRMEFSTGEGEPPPNVTELLANPAIPNASAPLDVDRPYASERNDIATEARYAHEKPVLGVAIGERAFSLRFPDDMELEGTVFPNAAGRVALRVFWEQW